MLPDRWEVPFGAEDLIYIACSGAWFLFHPGAHFLSIWLIPYIGALVVIRVLVGFIVGRRERRARVARGGPEKLE